VHPFGGHSGGERRQQVGAMHLIVREAKGGFQGLRERRAQERAAVVPAPLVPGERFHARPGHVLGESQPLQDA
jgi:hypothetical protein